MKIDVTLDDLRVRLSLVERIIKETDEKLALMPDGNLRIQHQGKSVTYYCARDNNGDRNGYIITDPGIISSLAQKSYLRKIRRSADQERKLILQLLKRYPDIKSEEVYSSLTDDRRSLVKPLVISDEEYARRWLEQPYKRKGFEDGAPLFTTIKGERVRSKAEVMIADRLFANNIPYRYECPVTVGNRVFHPDFTVLKVHTREVFYWEHCGAMDNQNYSDYAVDRFNKYAGNGILIGKNLIATFETGNCPLNSKTVDALIITHFK